MDNMQTQGDEFTRQARKKMKGSFFSNMFNSKDTRAGDALDLFQQAANCYKLAKNCINLLLWDRGKGKRRIPRMCRLR